MITINFKKKSHESFEKLTWQQGFLKQKNKMLSIPQVHDDGT